MSGYNGIHSLMLEIESAFQYFKRIFSFPCWGRISTSYLFTSDLSFKRQWCSSISVTFHMNYKKTSLTFSGFQDSEEDFCKTVRSQKKFRCLKKSCSKMWKKKLQVWNRMMASEVLQISNFSFFLHFLHVSPELYKNHIFIHFLRNT